MRKELSDFLTTDLQFIKGVGPVLAARLDEVLGGRRVLDFLMHRPSYVRRRDITEYVADATVGDTVTISLNVKSHRAAGVAPRPRLFAPINLARRSRYSSLMRTIWITG